jgi:uncharacterized protein
MGFSKSFYGQGRGKVHSIRLFRPFSVPMSSDREPLPPLADEPAPAATPGFDFSAAPEPPVAKRIEPTVQERVHAYDFIRGIAIFGILLANIPWFAEPALGDMLKMLHDPSGLDGQVDAWTTVFVAGKFRSMLAILFGVGMWLQFRKRSAVPGNWPGGYLKRMFFLAGFGIFHGLFLWFGDILFMYGAIAFVACLFVGQSDRVLKWIVGSSLALSILAGLGLAAGAYLWTPEPPDPSQESPFGFLDVSREAETQAYAEGSYLDQLKMRAIAFAMMSMGVVVFLPFLGGLMLFGALLGRHGILAKPSAHKRVRNRLLLFGLGLGLPLNFAMLPLLQRESGLLAMEAVELCAGPILSVGYITLLAMLAEAGWLGSMQRAVAKVGRTAFSNYILQTLICITLFYSWGFGLYGELNRLQLLAIPPAVWGANLLFAHYWLKRYRMGPLEWLWRSLTEGRKLPLGRADG